VGTDLTRIGEKARKERDLVFTSLYHHICDVDNLRGKGDVGVNANYSLHASNYVISSSLATGLLMTACKGKREVVTFVALLLLFFSGFN